MSSNERNKRLIQAVNVRKRLFDVIYYAQKNIIGVYSNEIDIRKYCKELVRHLVWLWKDLNDPYRKRAKILMFSLVTGAGTVALMGCYYVRRMYKRLRSYSQSRPPLLRGTRSQMRLSSGARIVYISEDRISETDDGSGSRIGCEHGQNKINVGGKKMGRVKKIFIPKRDGDVFEKDKYLFKSVETSYAPYSQLFYSKFLNQMSALIKILIPSWLDKNVMLLSLQVFFLIMRTWLSLFVARLDGQIVKDVIAGRGKRFLVDLASWFIIALPASYTNGAIKFLQRKLSLNFRIYLTRYIHDMYLDERLAFYKLMFDTQSDNSVIKNIDNSITNDVTKFCDAICSVFANIAKPIIDLIFFALYLRDNLGTIGIAGIFANYFFTAYILKKYTPPLGKLSSSESSAKGDFYNYLLKVSNNNEEIAFYQGTEVEKSKVTELYNNYFETISEIGKRKFKYTMIEDYILKYTWSAFGYVFAAIPVVISTLSWGQNLENRNMRDFVVNKRLMLSLADAGSRLMHSIKDISVLTGYTNRVFILLSVLHRVHFRRFNYGALVDKEIGYGDSKDMVRGTVQRSFHGIRFENIDVIIPSRRSNKGSKLINKLTFQIPFSIIRDLEKNNNLNPLMNNNNDSSLLILGPNSCGKSSIQRVIAEIWPVYNKNGLLSIPSQTNVFCIPQKPYFTKGGTLRDQIIYPMSCDEFFDRGLQDKMLVRILKEVNLDYLLKRETNWSYLNTVAEWKNVLSGGEKQRMNFARILFHKPRFVVLDEATNAISVDMEDYLFNVLKKYKFNFITISQRPSLIKYHDILLEINNNCSWQLQALGTTEAITSIDHEIEDLKTKLAGVAELEKEHKVLKQKLGAF